MDDSASGNSAPGVSGVVSPLGNLFQPGGYFLSEKDFSEPNTWREVLFKQLDAVRDNIKKKEIVDFRNKIIEQTNFDDMKITDFKLSDEDIERLLATANR